MGVEDMLTYIRRSKLTEGRPIKPVLPSQHQPQRDPTDSVCLFGEDSGRIKWIQPSGQSLSVIPCHINLQTMAAMLQISSKVHCFVAQLVWYGEERMMLHHHVKKHAHTHTTLKLPGCHVFTHDVNQAIDSQTIHM